MKRSVLATTLGLSLFTASAFAAEGYVTSNVNLRSGPDSSYPSVVRLRAGTSVAIEGCVDGWSWCDVSDGEERGWVPGNFLQEEYEGRRVLIRDYGVQIGVPVISFVFGTYWGEHYRHRSWYGSREHWSHFQPRYDAADVRITSGSGQREYSHMSSQQTQAAPAPTFRAGEQSRHAAVTTTQASHQTRSASPVVERPVATQSRTPARHASHTNSEHVNAGATQARAPEQHVAHVNQEHGNARATQVHTPEQHVVRATPEHVAAAPSQSVAPRPAVDHKTPPPRAIAEHKAAAAHAAKSEAPAKSPPEHDGGKHKDQP